MPADADPVIVSVPIQPARGVSILATLIRYGSSYAWAQYSGIDKYAFGNHHSWSDLQEDRIRVNGKIKHSLGTWADSCADDTSGDDAFCVTSFITIPAIPLTHTAWSRHRFQTSGYVDSDFTSEYSRVF